MIVLSIVLKLILFVSIVNVWFVRFDKPTQWRGGGAGSMKDEFRAYGLTGNLVYVVGAIKVLSALGLLLSIWFPVLTLPSAAVMAVMMAGAIVMHLKVKDPLKRSLPAATFLLFSLVLIAESLGYFAS